MKKPIDCLKTLKSLLGEINTLCKKLESSIKRAPEGSIVMKKMGSSVRLFKSQGGNAVEYLNNNNEAKKRQLAQKRYEEELLKEALREKSELERAIKRFEASKGARTLNQVFEKFPTEIKKFITPNIATNEGFIREWSRPEVWCDRNMAEFYGDYYTLNGERVRSKSELIIADRLNNAGIPYHYELEFVPTRGFAKFYPDFTVLNTNTFETWYWEHLGMMDDTKYSSFAKERLELYSEEGLVPGRNLIITFETSQSPLNTKYVDKLISLYLLRNYVSWHSS